MNIEYTVIVDGTETSWYHNGKLHREDGPALTDTDTGFEAWYVKGNLHKEDGPAMRDSTGKLSWYVNGKLHREDGPAVEHPRVKEWWVNGRKHRLDGPAVVEYAVGGDYEEWWIDGKRLTEEEFNYQVNPKELTVADVEKLLGYPVKIVK
jgi:hypothetical protein